MAGQTPPDPICGRCSKPIRRGTAAQLAGRAIHIRCLARETLLRATEALDHANRVHEHANEVVARANVIRGQAGTLRLCSLCQRPLSGAGSVLFKGDQLVHALCWREDGGPPPEKRN